MLPHFHVEVLMSLFYFFSTKSNYILNIFFLEFACVGRWCGISGKLTSNAHGILRMEETGSSDLTDFDSFQ